MGDTTVLHHGHWVIALSPSGRYVKCNVVMASLSVVYVNAAVWSLSPYVNAAQYVVEPFGVSCTLDWPQMSLAFLSVLITINYILPVFVMVFCHGHSVITSCKGFRRVRQLTQTPSHHRQDIRVAQVCCEFCRSISVFKNKSSKWTISKLTDCILWRHMTTWICVMIGWGIGLLPDEPTPEPMIVAT